MSSFSRRVFLRFGVAAPALALPAAANGSHRRPKTARVYHAVQSAGRGHLLAVGIPPADFRPKDPGDVPGVLDRIEVIHSRLNLVRAIRSARDRNRRLIVEAAGGPVAQWFVVLSRGRRSTSRKACGA